MEILGEILQTMDAEMNTPVPYGPFHITFFIASIAMAFGLIMKYPNPAQNTLRTILLAESLIVIVLEIYKQINYSFSYDGQSIILDYQWYAFPFQFCSTPMYIGFLAAVTKSRRLSSYFCSFLATYGLFAGLCVMFYPVSVFTNTIGINIQTMICHGFMVSIGIYLLASGTVATELSTLKKALPVFCCLVIIAVILNEFVYHSELSQGDVFNMFFISPYAAPELPLYSDIQGIVPFPLSIIIYILGFTAGSAVLLMIAKSLRFLHRYAFGWKRAARRYVHC